MHDLVISPTTGTIAYLIVGRGGIFGFDESYVPVRWHDFRVAANGSLLVLDTTEVMIAGAPSMSDKPFTAKGAFAQQSAKVGSCWQTAMTMKASN